MTDKRRAAPAPFETWVIDQYGQRVWPWLVDGEGQNRPIFTTPAGVQISIPGPWSPWVSPGQLSVVVGAERINLTQGALVVRDLTVTLDDLIWPSGSEEGTIIYPAYQGNIPVYPDIRVGGSLLIATVGNTCQGIIAAWWDAVIGTDRVFTEMKRCLIVRANLCADDANYKGVQRLILMALDRLRADTEFQAKGYYK